MRHVGKTFVDLPQHEGLTFFSTHNYCVFLPAKNQWNQVKDNNIEVSTAISQIKECLNQPWHLDQEILSIGFVFSFFWLWCIMSGLILGSAHAVKIFPQSMAPLLSLCHDHLVLTFPHFS